MGRLYSGRRPRQPIILQLLPVRCYFPIQMAGPMFLADTTATFISLPCGDGTVSDWTQLFPPDCCFGGGCSGRCNEYVLGSRLLCLAVSLMLTRITPGPIDGTDMARSNLRLYNHVVFWSSPPLPPPKRTTPCRPGSKAAEAAYTKRGCTAGDCSVHVVPS